MRPLRLATILLASATLTLLASGPAHAQQITITAMADSASTGDQVCSLREAINVANQTSVNTDCVFTGAAGTPEIILEPGTYAISRDGADDTNVNGDFDVTGTNLIVTGAGSGQTTVNGALKDRVFDVAAGRSLTLRDLTVTGGRAKPPGTGPVPGGGIRAAGPLTLERVSVTGNAASDGPDGTINTPGSAFSGGSGGGISSTDSLTVTDSVISGNHAGDGGTGGHPVGACATQATGGPGGSGGDGGGIVANGQGAVITRSTITANGAGFAGPGGCANTPGSGGTGGRGGGIFATNVALTDSTVSGNTAGAGSSAGSDGNGPNTSAPLGSGGAGGGIWQIGALSIVRSSITGNHAGTGGDGALGSLLTQATAGGAEGGSAGAILGWFGSMTIVDSSIEGNTSGKGGDSARFFAGPGGGAGAIFFQGASGDSLTITGSTISGNTSGAGGTSTTGPASGGLASALHVFSGNPNPLSVVVTNSTISGNTTGAGGANTGAGAGAPSGNSAIYLNPNAQLTLTHATFAFNQTGAGGAGAPDGARAPTGGLVVPDAFFKPLITFGNSIVAANDPANCEIGATGVTMVDGGHNVVFGSQCSGITAATTADPLLGTLADNGGLTKTMALADASPAIDIVPAAGAGCAATDQRGTARPIGNGCEAGAYESSRVPPSGDGGGSGTQTPTDQPGTGQAARDTRAPAVKLLLKKQKLRTALRKGYLAFFSDDELGTAVASLFAKGKDAKGTAARRKRVARGTLKITKTGKQKLVVKFTKKAKRAFKKRRKVTLSLVLTVKDAAGNTTKKTAKVVLKR
jgi:CSLREA domain-containing protein